MTTGYSRQFPSTPSASCGRSARKLSAPAYDAPEAVAARATIEQRKGDKEFYKALIAERAGCTAIGVPAKVHPHMPRGW